MLKYLQTNNQSPWAAGHAVINYRDTDRAREWDDACEFDTAWVEERNLERENLFRMEINQRYKGINDEALQEKLREAGKRKRHCVSEKELCKDLASLFLTHLRWHPFTHLPIFTEPDSSRIHVREVWREQAAEMHDACKKLGESWAWEYLWNHWYRPERWKIWARAVCSCIPIINSNSIVESLWSTLKRRYLRKHSRAKLEFLVDIIMNQHLHNLKMLITACRRGEKRPVWYVLKCLLLTVGITYSLKNGKRSVRWRRRIFRTAKIKLVSMKKSGRTTRQRSRIGGAGVLHIKQVQTIYASISLLCTLAKKDLNQINLQCRSMARCGDKQCLRLFGYLVFTISASSLSAIYNRYQKKIFRFLRRRVFVWIHLMKLMIMALKPSK